MKDLKHIIEDTKGQVLNFILEHDKTCGEGNYGIAFVTFTSELKLNPEVLKEALNELFRERKINVGESTIGKLTFLNYDNPEINAKYEKQKP